MRRTPAVPGAWVTGRTARFFYRVTGDPTGAPDTDTAVPVVLVHGLGVSSAYFARLQPLLAARHRVYAPDLPGFGRTRPRPTHARGAASLAAALADWMTALAMPRAHLVGHSLGGPVVAEFARQYPERVARLVLVGATIGPRSPQAPRQAVGLLRDFLREPPSVFPVLVADYVRAGTRRIVATEVIVDGEDTLGALAQVRAPTLIVRGDRDPIVSREDAARMRAAAPHACYREIAGAPHVVQWGHASHLARLIEGFLDAG